MTDKSLDLSMMDRSSRSLFVGNIPFQATEDEMKNIFSEVGPVLSLKLVFDRESGKPKGYGFCEYKDQETVLSAMRNLRSYEVAGRILRVVNAYSKKAQIEMAALLQDPPTENLEDQQIYDKIHFLDLILNGLIDEIQQFSGKSFEFKTLDEKLANIYLKLDEISILGNLRLKFERRSIHIKNSEAIKMLEQKVISTLIEELYVFSSPEEPEKHEDIGSSRNVHFDLAYDQIPDLSAASKTNSACGEDTTTGNVDVHCPSLIENFNDQNSPEMNNSSSPEEPENHKGHSQSVMKSPVKKQKNQEKRTKSIFCKIDPKTLKNIKFLDVAKLTVLQELVIKAVKTKNNFIACASPEAGGVAYTAAIFNYFCNYSKIEKVKEGSPNFIILISDNIEALKVAEMLGDVLGINTNVITKIADECWINFDKLICCHILIASMDIVVKIYKQIRPTFVSIIFDQIDAVKVEGFFMSQKAFKIDRTNAFVFASNLTSFSTDIFKNFLLVESNPYFKIGEHCFVNTIELKMWPARVLKVYYDGRIEIGIYERNKKKVVCLNELVKTSQFVNPYINIEDAPHDYLSSLKNFVDAVNDPNMSSLFENFVARYLVLNEETVEIEFSRKCLHVPEIDEGTKKRLENECQLVQINIEILKELISESANETKIVALMENLKEIATKLSKISFLKYETVFETIVTLINFENNQMITEEASQIFNIFKENFNFFYSESEFLLHFYEERDEFVKDTYNLSDCEKLLL